MYLHAAQAACCYVIYYTSIAEKVENILDESSKETIEDITCDTNKPYKKLLASTIDLCFFKALSYSHTVIN